MLLFSFFIFFSVYPRGHEIRKCPEMFVATSTTVGEESEVLGDIFLSTSLQVVDSHSDGEFHKTEIM